MVSATRWMSTAVAVPYILCTTCTEQAIRVLTFDSAVPDVVLNQLYRFTALQSSFGANMVALEGGRPLVIT